MMQNGGQVTQERVRCHRVGSGDTGRGQVTQEGAAHSLALALYPGGRRQSSRRPSAAMRRMLLAARYTSCRAALAVR